MPKLARITTLLCLSLTLFVAISPIERGCFRQALSYNEGWNIYNATVLRAHGQLYPAHDGLTANNYPMLSFAVTAALRDVTGSYIITSRAVSQISTILLCALLFFLLKQLGASRWASTLGALFCYALFATDTARAYALTSYTNAADPEMLGLMVCIGGLVLYAWSKRSDTLWPLFASALTFVVGLSVKHSSVAIVIAVFIDCCWYQRKRLLPFLSFFTVCVLLSVLLQLRYGGPWFLHNLLESRMFERGRALHTFNALFLPVGMPFASAALFVAMQCRTEKLRLVLILFVATCATGFYIGSSEGVTINCFFPLLITLSIALGLWFDEMQRRSGTALEAAVTCFVPLCFFASLLYPAHLNSDLRPTRTLRESIAAQAVLDSEVSYLQNRPGPALCENLLTCFLAGKPYIYDPFNATRLVHLGRLDDSGLIDSIRRRKYSAIEVQRAEMVMADGNYKSERFPQQVLQAIKQSYQIGYQHDDLLVYIPRS